MHGNKKDTTPSQPRRWSLTYLPDIPPFLPTLTYNPPPGSFLKLLTFALLALFIYSCMKFTYPFNFVTYHFVLFITNSVYNTLISDHSLLRTQYAIQISLLALFSPDIEFSRTFNFMRTQYAIQISLLALFIQTLNFQGYYKRA